MLAGGVTVTGITVSGVMGADTAVSGVPTPAPEQPARKTAPHAARTARKIPFCKDHYSKLHERSLPHENPAILRQRVLPSVTGSCPPAVAT